jgi:glycosyltransferase involved in cell wall biosynthesis
MMKQSPPKISIIIGVLNMARYLSATLDSAIRQNYPDLELIVMDGGSTDGTLDIIKQYEKHISYWKSGKDKGHSDACNNAINIATGDFIHLLNADDIIDDSLLHKVAELYSRRPNAQVISCGVRIVESDGANKNKILQEISDPEKLQLSLNNILFELPVINARFFHKNIFKDFGQFQPTHEDGSYNLSNDRDFLIRLALAGVSTEIIAEPLYLYLSHDESLTFSQKHVIKSRKEHLKLAEKFLQKSDLTTQQKKLFQSWLAHESVYLCLIYLKRGKIIDSLQTVKYGISHCGSSWLLKLMNVVSKTVYKNSKKIFSRFKNPDAAHKAPV